MPWAKLESKAKYNLATSGVDSLALRDLPISLEDLELSAPGAYGYPPLMQAMSKLTGVEQDRIVIATGTSMANYLAMATAAHSGDEVLIEHPTYELILAVARYLNFDVKRFVRSHESGFALEPKSIEQKLTPRTRLIVITNLHNPSSALADESTIRAVGAIAKSVGAKVLVDEVYLDAAFEHAPESAAHFGDEFIVTSSLTKVYGLSGLRCGWVIAEPGLAHAAWRLNDLFGVNPAHLAERASIVALNELPRIRARVKQRLDANRAVLHRFFDSRADIDVPRFAWGTTAFPRLLQGTCSGLCKLLREKYETSVVPGEYFEMPDHFRIGIGGELAPLEEGLRRLDLALDELQA